MKKKLVLIMITILSVVSICAVNPKKTYAMSNDGNDFNGKFEGFIDDCYRDLGKVSILDNNGLDAKAIFINETLLLYQTRNYKDIKDIIYNKKYNISIMEEGIQLYATNAKTATVRVYHIQSDKTDHFKKEWFTYITTTFTYDQNTYIINTVNTPSVTIDANFGLNFSVSTSSISTRAYINSDKRSVKLSAQYNLSATLTIVGIIGKKYDWGTINASGSVDPWS